jgi:NCS2 family nucleobase:cation symporter-2
VDSSDKIFHFMENQGAAWGARKEVIYNAMSAMNELMEALALHSATGQKIAMTVAFDELSLDVRISYEGEPLEFPTERPDKTQLRTDPGALALMSGFLVRQYTDEITVAQEGKTCSVMLHFDH